MMNRCYTKTNKDYPSIGGEGITVCDEWHSYDNFIRDMGEKPKNTNLARYCAGIGFTKENTYWSEKVNARNNRLYGIWKGMRRRCGVLGKSNNHAASYINSGIAISPDWENDFVKFALDVGQPPSDEHSLDRIDNNLGYFPGNVRWALPKDQANNTSSNIVIIMDGQQKTLQQWCDFFGVDRNIVSSRWRTLFSQPKRKNSAFCQYSMAGEFIAEYTSVKIAAVATGIKSGTIAKCLSGGNASAGGFLWRYND